MAVSANVEMAWVGEKVVTAVREVVDLLIARQLRESEADYASHDLRASRWRGHTSDDEPDNEDYSTVNDHLIHAWHEHNSPRPTAPFETREGTATWLRDSLHTASMMHSLTGLRDFKDASDDALLAAAKDAWDSRRSLHQRYRSRSKEFGSPDVAEFIKKAKARKGIR